MCSMAPRRQFSQFSRSIQALMHRNSQRKGQMHRTLLGEKNEASRGPDLPIDSPGASGFGSHGSICLGAPQLKIKMTDLALPEAGARDSTARAQWVHNGTKAPPNPSNTLRRDVRREKPRTAKPDAVGFSAGFIAVHLGLNQQGSNSLVKALTQRTRSFGDSPPE